MLQVKKGFMRKSHLYSHYQREHAAEQQKVCMLCGMFCETIEEHVAHMALHNALAK